MENDNRSSGMIGKKQNMSKKMSACDLCPRECRADRNAGKKGFCGMDAGIYLARAALHMWEEPCISGTKGSGTVFFSGCGLRCCFCQNHDIAIGSRGRAVSVERLGEIFLELKEKGAANINLVTGAHYVPQIIETLDMARRNGLDIPVVYNSSGYEKTETLKLLEGYVDIYLPDFKYMESDLAGKYSHAKDYPEIAREALAEMVRQAGTPEFDDRGMMKKGVIVRHLLLPGHVRNSRKVLEYLYETYKDQIYISLMNQYTPMPAVMEDPQLSRKVTDREYDRLLDHAISLGVTNCFIQEGETAKESFIPEFDGEGIE